MEQSEDQSVKDRIEKLNLRNTVLEVFSQSLSHPMKIIENRFEHLKLEIV